MNRSPRELPLRAILTAAVLATTVSGLRGAEQPASTDWPHFLGRDGKSMASEVVVNRDWGAKPPPVLWRLPMKDEGHSGPAVADGIVYGPNSQITNN